MSVFLQDRVWVMLSEISKRGVYPLHGYKLGIFRLPVNLTEESTINNIFNELKKTNFKLDRYADRIYITHSWKEEDKDDLTGKILSISQIGRASCRERGAVRGGNRSCSG